MKPLSKIYSEAAGKEYVDPEEREENLAVTEQHLQWLALPNTRTLLAWLEAEELEAMKRARATTEPAKTREQLDKSLAFRKVIDYVRRNNAV